MRAKKIVIIGTGYVGLPAALMWARSGHKVVGVDINENVVQAINDRSMHLNEREVHELINHPIVEQNLIASRTPSEGDVFVIAVPTPADPLKKVCDLTAVQSAIQSIAPFLRNGNLLIVESTVPPMTCRNVIKPWIEKLTGLRIPEDVMLAHCPERLFPGDVFWEIVHNHRLMGGMDERSAAAAAEIYSSFVEGELHCTDDVSAELAKLMENTYRDVNVALANEFAQICELLRVDARNVIALANKHPRVDILNPGIGVGGHCIPVDPWFLKEVAPYNSRLITMARLINDEMPARITAKIRKAVADLADPRIVALGATYKKDCVDLRESPAMKIVESLLLDGYHVSHYDPLVPEMRYQSISAIANGVDLIAVLVPHKSIMQEFAANRAQIMRNMRHDRIVFFDE
jgi:UDP-N-acetyl-D-mannosaminuronic acid dehydrogenase